VIRQPLGRTIVVCEGASDDAFVRHLIDRRKLGAITVVYPEAPEPGGRQGFGSVLRTLRTLRGFETVTGIIILSDNDADPTGSFSEVQEQIRTADRYGVPSKPEEWTTGRGTPPIAVYMLPRANVEGDLEQLCLTAARDQWPNILACADEFARCTGAENWPTNKRSKMLLRSVLSAVCRTDPNTSLVYLWSRGSAGADYEIQLTHRCFDEFVNFLGTVPKR